LISRHSRIVLVLACMAGVLLAAPASAGAAVSLLGISGLTNDNTPTFNGNAAIGPDGADEVIVEIAGTATATLPTTRDPVSGDFGPVTSGALPDGNYTAQAKQADNGGEATSNVLSFTIDTTPPTVVVNSGPTGTTGPSSGPFIFSSNEAGSTFECKMDPGGAWVAGCTSPKSYTGLASGSHTFRVRATDAAGNQGAPAARSFTVDATPPVASISAGPSGPTNSTSPSFSFTSNEAGSTFECKMDPGGPWGGCTSPKAYSELAAGAHTFRVRPKDGLGNVGAIVNRAFTVDTTPPNTTITAGPAGTTTSAVATFSFSSTEADSTFQCRMDAGAWKTCASPHTFSGLGEGNRTAEIRAVDPAGNPDPSPASRSWTILDLHPPTASFTVTPASPMSGETVTLKSTSTDPDNALERQSWDLDNDGRFNDGSDPVVGHVWAKPGSYKVRLLVVDAQGITVVAEKVIPVGNRSPTAKISSSPSSLRVGRKVTFNSTAADPDGSVAKVVWDLDGDGKYDDAAGATASRTYRKAGKVKVGVQVTDELGASTTAAQSVRIAEQAMLSPFPIVRISGRFTRRGVSLSRLLVEVPKGARVLISCRGKGCPRKRVSRAAETRGPAAKSLRFKTFERFLPSGTVLDVRVTKTGQIGKFTRIRVRSGRAPTRSDKCLKRGKSVRCPT